MSDTVREPARSLFMSAVHRSDRILVTGAGGWFGATVAALLHGATQPTMFVTQRPRSVPYGLGAVDAVAWDWAHIRDFAPTVVIDCAFVLRDFIPDMPLEKYVHANTVLTSRLLQLAQLPGMRAVVSVSSGAAIHPVDASTTEVDLDPYGVLKRQAELALIGLGETIDAVTVIARPWSLTGSLVTRPERYAFSDMLLQARAGGIHVAAGHQVWRRYVGVDDFFAVALAKASRSSGVLNSGGHLIEFGALAERICQVLGVAPAVTRTAASSAPADDYYTRDDTWDRECDAAAFTAAGLDAQIHAVDTYLRGRRHRAGPA